MSSLCPVAKYLVHTALCRLASKVGTGFGTRGGSTPGGSERPKRPKSVSAETEISGKLTEISAEISAEILTKIT